MQHEIKINSEESLEENIEGKNDANDDENH